jgi:hypothetical protein
LQHHGHRSIGNAPPFLEERDGREESGESRKRREQASKGKVERLSA